MRELRLQPGEQIVFTARPGGWTLITSYLLTLGMYAQQRRRTTFTVTNQRVIYATGIISKTTRSVPVRMVQDAHVKTSLGVGSVTLSSAGGPLSVERFGHAGG